MQMKMTADQAKFMYEEILEALDVMSDEDQEKFQEITSAIADIMLRDEEMGILAIYFFFWQSMMMMLHLQESADSENTEKI